MKREKAVVFGIGEYYTKISDWIDSMYDVSYYIDNNTKKRGIEENEGKMMGKVFSPLKILEDSSTKVILVAIDFMSMYYQLNELGVRDDRIIIAVNYKPEYEWIRYLRDRGIFVVDNGRIYYDKHGCKILLSTTDVLYDLYLTEYRFETGRNDVVLSMFNQIPNKPISRVFGCDRGTAVDRIYIEKFLEENQSVITGDVLEIGENRYTTKYGNAIRSSSVLHVKGWGGENTICGNLETGEGIEGRCFDCLILTQTLMFIYGLDNVVKNIYNLLKPGGTALITVSGISQISEYDNDNWGQYWSFYGCAFRPLFNKKFSSDNIIVKQYGNVKTAIALLYGITAEELRTEDIIYQDNLYPLIYGISLKK